MNMKSFLFLGLALLATSAKAGISFEFLAADNFSSTGAVRVIEDDRTFQVTGAFVDLCNNKIGVEDIVGIYLVTYGIIVTHSNQIFAVEECVFNNEGGKRYNEMPALTNYVGKYSKCLKIGAAQQPSGWMTGIVTPVTVVLLKK